MYLLNWHITIGKYQVRTLKSVKIATSVLNLLNTAAIELPGQYLNTWVKIEDKIAVGDEVTIQLGYDKTIATEFQGFLKRISRNNNGLVLECEDSLFLLNKSINNKEYKAQTASAIMKDLLRQVDKTLTMECEVDYPMAKFVTFHNTALDVLKKIHEETKANIWFEGKTLKIKPVYSVEETVPAVIYDMAINVQSNNLKWIDASDKKVEIEVVYKKPDGTQLKETYGNKGGQKVTRVVQSNTPTDMQWTAENEYNLWNYSGFEGSFTGWLLPRVTAGGSVRLRDANRPEGKYYVTGVEIEFGHNGAKRNISLGRKLG